MTEVKGFLRFDEMLIEGRHLKGVPADQAAFMSLLLCAYNEVNTLLRLYSLNAREIPAPKPAALVSLSTKMFLARTLSAKLFEVVELLKGKQTWNKTDDLVIKKFSTESLNQFQKLQTDDGYRIARTLRSECSNHYSLTAARKSVASLEDDLDLTFFIHKTEGNSFALAGERVVFDERFRVGTLPKGETDGTSLFETWLDWTLSAIKWLKSICAEFVFLVLPDSATSRIKRNQLYWPEGDVIGDLNESFAPIFLREKRA